MRVTDSPLATRSDFQKVLLALANPLTRRRSSGRARVSLGATGAHFSVCDADLEGFARPLWGVAPYVAGGGCGLDLRDYRTGLIHGTDPDHPEYWGRTEDYAHPFVEMAPIAFALQLVGADLIGALPATCRTALACWLDQINVRRVHDNNWLFFRVLVNVALARFGLERADHIEADLQRLDSMYLGDGWYADGPGGRVDYYTAFAFHYYGLLYARLAPPGTSEWPHRLRSRAAAFACQFRHWFDRDGRAVPFGRSLTYRAALGAFWGALAFADVEALPWEVIKGMALRHLRGWLHQPILDGGGLLTIGYGYPNLNIAERYNGPASPYWMFKCFLPLALPETHPFWQAIEAPPPSTTQVQLQRTAGMIACADRDHTFLLNAGQSGRDVRHGEAKYGKFAYSSRFGFSIPSGALEASQGAFDSALALSEEGRYFRTRVESSTLRVDGSVIHSCWRPWPSVAVDTWLVPCVPWHIRLHRLQTDRPLLSHEGGFSIPRDDGRESVQVASDRVLVWTSAGWCAVQDLGSGRSARVEYPDPNTNVLYARTLLPTLVGRHPPGVHWLACAVAAGVGAEEVWSAPPQFALVAEGPGRVATIAFGGETVSFEAVPAGGEPGNR